MVVVSHLQRSFVTGSQQLLHKNTCKTPCWQTLVSLRRIMTFHVTSINKSAILLSVATTEILMIQNLYVKTSNNAGTEEQQVHNSVY